MSVQIGGAPYRYIVGSIPLSGDKMIEFSRPGWDGDGQHAIGFRGDTGKVKAKAAFATYSLRAIAKVHAKLNQGRFVTVTDFDGLTWLYLLCTDVQFSDEVQVALDSNNERYHMTVEYTLKSTFTRAAMAAL